jgi:general secretion pathway protein M
MTIREAWDRRSARERSVLAAGAIALAVLLFVALAWIPLERTRARLEREVPELRASVAALQRDADEVRRLRAMPPVATAAGQPLSSLAAGGLAAPPGARLTLAGDRHLKLAGDDVGFAALLEWLSSTAAAQGLRVESARLEARPEPGRVRAEITLARS